MNEREVRSASRAWTFGLTLAASATVASFTPSCGGVSDAGGHLDASAQADGLSLFTDTPGCTPRSCQASGFTCGQNADGCGGLADCGACTGNDYCGGGGFSRCGAGDSGAGSCTPKTCATLGYTCGPNADGCGGVVDCGACPQPTFCGGTGFSRCGAPASGDGGTPPACVPTTCASMAVTCGPVGDGCGNLLQCGSCTGHDTCGGGGSPGVCGHACAGSGLCTQQVACTGTPTTITGRVLAGESTWVPPGATPDPVPNAVVYVPTTTVAPFAAGVQCTQCGAEVSGDPLVTAITAYDGTFTLSNVPVGSKIPLVVQLGRWRRQVTFDAPTACATVAVGDIHLPRTESEGDIPLTAIATGAVDSIECILLKMGVDEREFAGTESGSSGRIHLYSAGFGSADVNGHGPGAALIDSQPESALLGSGGTYGAYDQIMLPCWGDEFLKSSDELASLVTYANGGGRFFATHFSYTWLFQNSPFDATATWDVNANRNSTANGGAGVPFTGSVDVAHNPKGAVFAQWLNLLGGLSTAAPPQVTIQAGRHDVDAVSGSSVDWIDGTDPSPPSPARSSMLLHYTFDTPVGQGAQCGHAIYSDFHVNNQTSTNASIFPDECDTSALTPQERILEYMIWDLQSCVAPPPTSTGCTPLTCAAQHLACGPAGDGCGNVIQCGACGPGQTCGGGGIAGQCSGSPDGGASCTPASCAAQGLDCGPAGDGCGHLLACGTCSPGSVCGGAGPGKCGPDQCAPTACAPQQIECGPAGDGCGGVLDCGTCSTADTCGKGGFGRCGTPPQ